MICPKKEEPTSRFSPIFVADNLQQRLSSFLKLQAALGEIFSSFIFERSEDARFAFVLWKAQRCKITGATTAARKARVIAYQSIRFTFLQGRLASMSFLKSKDQCERIASWFHSLACV